MSTSRIAELEQANARLSGSLEDLTAAHTTISEAHTKLQENYEVLQAQLNWFQRQLFGRKSEKRLAFDVSEQENLLAALGLEEALPDQDPPSETITYKRRKKQRNAAVNDTGLRFDDTVPIETIIVQDPTIDAIPIDQRECIAEKHTYLLAQQPSSYTILKYVRQVVKRRDTGQLITAAAPRKVLERTAVDVSYLAGMLLDKFLYHLPLYRQHLRLRDSGITVSRRSLTNWAGHAIDLLQPIVAAQSDHILQSAVLAMDETPIKAGRSAPGKMHQSYFWPVYGDADEVVFHYAPSRGHQHVTTFLGDFRGTLLSDGYAAYAAWAKQNEVSHAQCWSHARRYFEQAQESEPTAVATALSLIGSLYTHEKEIRQRGLVAAEKLVWRQEHSAPVVRQFFDWCHHQSHRVDLLPKSLLAKALHYVREREPALSVFLQDPKVQIDTNHLYADKFLMPTMSAKLLIFLSALMNLSALKCSQRVEKHPQFVIWAIDTFGNLCFPHDSCISINRPMTVATCLH